MIKLNYQLVRNENDGKITYTPQDYPSEFDNLVSIKGPNGSGKSAILHIIALALYGNTLSSEEIDSGLKRRIDNLLDLDHNKLTFDLEITSPDNSLTIISRKSDPNTRDIDVYVIKDGESSIYPKDRFNREFRLLYTIPNNPTAQLPQLLNEIRVSQTELGSRIMQFRHYLQDQIRNLESSRDEASLEIARRECDQTREIKTKTGNDLFSLEEKNKKYETYFAVRIYLECTKRLVSINEQISQIDGEISNLERGAGRRTRAEKVTDRRYNEILDSIENDKDNILPIVVRYSFPGVRARLENIRDASVLNEIKRPHLQRTIRDNIERFIEDLKSLADSERTVNARQLDALDLYSALLDVLKNTRFYRLTIPGTDGDVVSLIRQIETARNNILDVKDRIAKYDDDIKVLQSFKTTLEEAITLQGQIREQNADADNPPEAIRLQNLQQKRSQLNSQFRTINEKRENAKTRLQNLKEDPSRAPLLEPILRNDPQVSTFSILSETEQDAEIRQNKSEITKLRFRFDQLSKLYRLQNEEIERLERQDVDPNRIYLPNIRAIDNVLAPLETMFRSNLPRSLNNIEGRTVTSDLDTRFSKIIGSFYAKKMKTVLYGENEYKVSIVDVVNEIITTTTGKQIKFDELSTGQSQSSYLTTRLGMTDTKKVIALFDEVAMMDNRSLEPVISLLKSNYQAGELLASIIVQRADSPIVERLV